MPKAGAIWIVFAFTEDCLSFKIVTMLMCHSNPENNDSEF